MVKKSLKYFFIAFVNAATLTILLAMWTDKLEIMFNDFVRPIEFLKIIGLTILCLICMGILVQVFRKRKIQESKTRIVFSVILTFVISSYFYVTYSIKVTNVLFNPTRHSLSKQVWRSPMLNGSQGHGLTYAEYQELRKIKGFPALPESAEYISFSLDYDGFLPDYGLQIDYEVPLSTNIDEIHINKGHDYSLDQTFKIENGKKLVTYFEVVR